MATLSPALGTADEGIRNRLSILRGTFYPSIQKGDEALATFAKGWSALLEAVSAYSDNLQDETYSMVDSFAHVVNTTASSILEIQDGSEPIHKKFEKELEKIVEVDLKQLSINDKLPEPANTLQLPYIEQCYKWLLCHLHNPYPSRNLRSQISRHTRREEKVIDAWFVDARKRIGWNELRKARFESRTDMVKAATKFFKPSSRPLRQGPYNRPTEEQLDMTDYSPEFAAIDDCAHNLYSDKFFPTTLATQLRLPIKQSTPHPELHTLSRQHSCQASSHSRTPSADPTLPYPSPAPSPACADDPTCPRSILDDISPTQDRGRKRRMVSVEPEAISQDGPRPRRPLKRNKAPKITDHDAVASLPSPVASIYDLAAEYSPSYVAPSPRDLIPSTSSHKRSISPDTDDEQPSHKRLRQLSETNEEHQSFTSGSSLSSDISPLPQQPSSSPTPVRPTESPSDIPASNSVKRKRRLSDADGETRAKRPHNAMSVPRLQTISDPFPLTKPAETDEFAAWWQECMQAGRALDMVNTPSAVKVETFTPDNSPPLDIEFQSYTDIYSTPSLSPWSESSELDDANVAIHSPDPDFGEISTVETFVNEPGHFDFNVVFPDIGNTFLPVQVQDFAYDANAIEGLTSFMSPDLSTPIVDQNFLGSTCFSGVPSMASWYSGNFQFDSSLTADPQLYGMPTPKFPADVSTMIPSMNPIMPNVDNFYIFDDRLAIQQKVEVLQEELRIAQEQLALQRTLGQ